MGSDISISEAAGQIVDPNATRYSPQFQSPEAMANIAAGRPANVSAAQVQDCVFSHSDAADALLCSHVFLVRISEQKKYKKNRNTRKTDENKRTQKLQSTKKGEHTCNTTA